jgi:hypothetical protein
MWWKRRCLFGQRFFKQFLQFVEQQLVFKQLIQ